MLSLALVTDRRARCSSHPLRASSTLVPTSGTRRPHRVDGTSNAGTGERAAPRGDGAAGVGYSLLYLGRVAGPCHGLIDAQQGLSRGASHPICSSVTDDRE